MHEQSLLPILPFRQSAAPSPGDWHPDLMGMDEPFDPFEPYTERARQSHMDVLRAAGAASASASDRDNGLGGRANMMPSAASPAANSIDMRKSVLDIMYAAAIASKDTSP